MDAEDDACLVAAVVLAEWVRDEGAGEVERLRAPDGVAAADFSGDDGEGRPDREGPGDADDADDDGGDGGGADEEGGEHAEGEDDEADGPGTAEGEPWDDEMLEDAVYAGCEAL